MFNLPLLTRVVARRSSACALAILASLAGLGSAARAQSYSVSDPVILQDFDSTYLSIENKMPDIFQSGYGSVYLPPPGYSTTTNSVGYDVYNRFDLGTAQQPTTYGTQNEFEGVVNGIHAFGGKAIVDMLWNDSGSMDANTTGFAASGGYPGLAVTLQDTNPSAPGYNTLGYEANGTSAGSSYTDNGTTYYYSGDYHAPGEPANGIDGQVAGLDDIAQETNFQLIRQPTTAGNPRNIPEGTTPWNGYLANVPTATNAQYYPDLSMTPRTEYDAALNQTFTIYPFNTSAPMSGTAVAENAQGYLMRYDQWMIQDLGVDGFRIDAAIDMPSWELNYYDAAVYNASNRTLLNGQKEQIFGYSEDYYSSTSTAKQYVNLTDTNGGASSNIEGNRDVMDFSLYQAMYNNLNAFNGAYGQSGGNSWYNVVDSSLDFADDGYINGSEGVKFVNDQDGGVPAPGLVQVAYAYMLMLPGQAVVYYNGQNVNNENSTTTTSGNFPEGGASDPKDSSMGALGGNFDTNVQNSQYSNLAITNLVDLRNRYGRGNYYQDYLSQNLLAYERQDSCLVVLSNSTTPGYEQESFNVGFAPGTWLEEMTGNATSSYADPNGNVPQFIQVQNAGNGQGYVNATFLNNGTYAKGSTTSTYATNDGFLIYALPTPTGTLATVGTSSVMASQTNNTVTVPGNFEPAANYANGTQRNASVNVVTGSSFTIALGTNEALLNVPGQFSAYHDVDADGSSAEFTIDGGAITVASNGTTSTTPGTNGEDTNPSDVTYGYQSFALSNPGYNNAASNYQGTYSQIIDTANLSIGYHYIEAIAFRYNSNASAPPVYSDWYDTIYVDRGTPSASVGSFQPLASAPTNFNNRQLQVASDGTTTSEYVYLNLPAGITSAQIMNMVTTGNNTIGTATYQGGLAGQIDQATFAWGFNGVQNGNNVATIVSFRPDGNSSITRITASQMTDLGLADTDGLGLGDLNADNHINNTDVLAFYNNVNSNGQAFNPAADMNGTGLNDVNDWLLFGQELTQNDTLSPSNPDYVSSSTISYYQGLSSTIELTIPAAGSYALQVPGATAPLGQLTMGAGATLNVTGPTSSPNTAYSTSFTTVSLSGNAIFNVSPNGSGVATLSLGSFNDGGTASNIHLTGNGAVDFTGGGNLIKASSLTIDPGITLNLNGSNTLGSNGISVTSNGTLNVNGSATVGNITSSGPLTIGATANATLKLATNSGTSNLISLTINGNSRFDINNDQVILNYGAGPDPVAVIRQYLVNGYNSGLWNGAGGINSSAAGGSTTYGIGYADAADPGNPADLLPGTLEVQYALLGDANLDGVVNGIDFGILAANFNKGADAWDQGDFTYTGVVNGVDFGDLAANFNQGGVVGYQGQSTGDWAAIISFAQANGLMAEVPEPAIGGLLALNFAALLSRRRRYSRGKSRQSPGRTPANSGPNFTSCTNGCGL